MVGELVDGRARYQTINSCITPIGQLAGKHLVTVEGLAHKGVLHPVQEQMVLCHGSQCGFCTPGFVMSLANMVETGEAATQERVLQGISGNLCRCTGYRPIVQAGLNALKGGHDSRLSDKSCFPSSPGEPGPVLQPRNEAELQAAMAENSGALMIAGGTDLMLDVSQRYAALPLLIDLTRVAELNRLEITAERYIIGSALSYTSIEASLGDVSTQLLRLLHRLGSRQIRNTGTIGGNLANGSPIADMPPVLTAWDAQLELVKQTALHG